MLIQKMWCGAQESSLRHPGHILKDTQLSIIPSYATDHVTQSFLQWLDKVKLLYQSTNKEQTSHHRIGRAKTVRDKHGANTVKENHSMTFLN